jgi:hypothetical protein
MEDTGKKRFAAAGIVAAGIVYFLACATPLPKELVLVPSWARSLAQAPSAPGAREAAGALAPIPFRLGDRYGYFTQDGTVLFSAAQSYGVALAEDAFAPYERLSEGFSILSPEGQVQAKAAIVGYPFFAAGRRFVIAPDQASVSELASSGQATWTYHFPSIVTTFDASPSVAAFGLVDGGIVGLDKAGKAVLDFAPGGSRIAGVYGVAISPDGQLVAAVTGLDKQRLVVMEKRATAYRVAYHRYLSSDFRRVIYMGFTSDGRHLEYESPSGIGVYDRDTRQETIVPVPTGYKLGLTARAGRLLAILSGDGTESRLVCAELPDRRVLDVAFQAKQAFVDTRGDAIFLGADDILERMDLRER